MSAQRFEELTADLMKAMGFLDVKRVGKTADRGVDVEAYKEDEFGHRWKYIIQCKYFNEGPVSSPDLQKFVGAISIHGADRGVFITSSSFTNEAQEIASKDLITLIDGKNFNELCDKYGLEEIIKKKSRLKRSQLSKPKTFHDLFDTLMFGSGENQPFIIPQIEPIAFLEGFAISLEHGSDIKLDEIEITDARIEIRGLFIVEWEVEKAWHDSQGRVRRTWSGHGTYVTDERGNTIYDVGTERGNINRSPLIKYINDQQRQDYHILTRKFNVILPKINRVPYKKDIAINGIPNQDIYCKTRKCYVTTKFILEYKYRQKKCSFIFNCIDDKIENNRPTFSKQEAQIITVKENPELETEDFTISDEGNKWRVTSNKQNVTVDVHKFSGRVLSEKTAAESIIEKATQEANKIFLDAKYKGNINLNIIVGQTCQSFWKLSFISKNGTLEVTSKINRDMTLQKRINEKYALELAQYENKSKSELLKMEKDNQGYLFYFLDEQYDWKLLVDYEGNTKVMNFYLTWNEAVKRAINYLINENIETPNLITKQIASKETYELIFQSKLDGKYWIQITNTPNKYSCEITKQIITERRAKYLAKKQSHDEVISFKKRLFGLRDGWQVEITDEKGIKKEIRIKSNGEIIIIKSG